MTAAIWWAINHAVPLMAAAVLTIAAVAAHNPQTAADAVRRERP